MGRTEAEDTLTMISYGVEISIAGGAADKKDEGVGGFFLFILYIIYSLLRAKKSHRVLPMAKTEPKSPKQTNKGNIHRQSSA